MRPTLGAVFIAVAIALLWMAATGNLDRLAQAWHDLTNGAPAAGTATASAGASIPSITPPTVPNMILQLPSLPSYGAP